MRFLSRPIEVILDLVESMVLAIFLAIQAPFLVLRFPLGNHWILLRSLLPEGLWAAYLRSQLNNRMRNFQGSAVLLDQILRACENRYEREQGKDFTTGPALTELYRALMGCYLKMGQFDRAANLVLRAQKCMGVESIKGYAEMGVQSAHIIKAGLAAGKLLDEGGLRDLFDSGKPIVIRKHTPMGSGDKRPATELHVHKPGKVIPFRQTAAKKTDN